MTISESLSIPVSVPPNRPLLPQPLTAMTAIAIPAAIASLEKIFISMSVVYQSVNIAYIVDVGK